MADINPIEASKLQGMKSLKSQQQEATVNAREARRSEAYKHLEEEKAIWVEQEKLRKSAHSVVNEKMKSTASVIQAVSNKFSSNPMYTTFLEFKMNDLVVNCCSSDPNKNILMSFDNSKNGTGQANSFNVRIAYGPQLGENFNINLIDNEITKGTRDGFTMSSRFCTLTYGYGDNASLRTVTYNGFVTDYTCDIQDGLLVYDISGYSGIAMWTESKDPLPLNIPANDKDAEGKVKPTVAARYIVETYLGETSNALTAKPYKVIFDDNVEGSDIPITLPATVDKNPGKALTDILNKAVAKADQDAANNDNSDSIDPAKKHIYSWYLSDTVGDDETSGAIYITCYSAESLKQEATPAAMVFNWMSPGAEGEANHIVHSFKPEFKGSVLLTLAANTLNKVYNQSAKDERERIIKSCTTLPSNVAGPVLPQSAAESVANATSVAVTDENLFDGSFFVNNSGAIERCQSSLAPVVGGEAENVNMNIEAQKSTWARELQYPYTATMVTAGIPCEIPITGIIKVVPMIYGQPHFSAGRYLIKSTRDVINSGGTFTTEWELMKIDMIVSLSNSQQNAN